ncbi:EAL domain-containing protein [Sphingomonas xinjiangensis]|uniref:EAL domain-containing protein (Putative c-di-GMP-specific phosphodiesterase class I) n=1 Tax=Sphingomonas xinjiangensis TaxID=643568 RepID=A0A840YPH9_9SPHN|nr:EAL domain-containing protein [Sphingomonas xinjiangensis]MBB5709772.1 EAL domain-containing protein (putative c-di-GMP-specific phosphodiesterase class I) [Sphingomonas xinjiangensis]
MTQLGCRGCREGAEDFGLAMAFQPIVDVNTGHAFAYEALVRGANGESAGDVLGRVTEASRYAFDQQCRVAAIEQAVDAGILDTGARLSINFLPNAVYSPMACIQLTLKTARKTGLPSDRLIFEFTEGEEMVDTDHVASIIEAYQRLGFATALDDFGAGHAGLGLLARLQTDLIKLDMELVRGIDTSLPRRMIVEGVMRMMQGLNITVIAEGIETEAEYATLTNLGVRYQQGYLFARPALRALPEIRMPTGTARQAA